MKLIFKLIIIFFIIMIYIISINIFANLISISSDNYEISKTIISDDSVVKINVGMSVGVSVTRPRAYGTFYQNNGNSYLYLFNLIKIPHEIKNYNFIWFHLIFLVGITLFSFLIFTKKKVYKGGNTNLEHEKLA